MRPDGRLIGWTETISFAIKPPKTLRTRGNATDAKPWTSPPAIEEASLRSWAAWFSSKRAIPFFALSLPRPSRSPVRSHFSNRAAPSFLRDLSTMPSVNFFSTDMFKSPYIIFYLSQPRFSILLQMNHLELYSLGRGCDEKELVLKQSYLLLRSTILAYYS